MRVSCFSYLCSFKFFNKNFKLCIFTINNIFYFFYAGFKIIIGDDIHLKSNLFLQFFKKIAIKMGKTWRSHYFFSQSFLFQTVLLSLNGPLLFINSLSIVFDKIRRFLKLIVVLMNTTLQNILLFLLKKFLLFFLNFLSKFSVQILINIFRNLNLCFWRFLAIQFF